MVAVASCELVARARPTAAGPGRRARGRRRRARRVPRSARSTSSCAAASGWRSSGRNGSGKSTLLEALLGAAAARARHAADRPGGPVRRARPGARRLRRPSSCSTASSPRRRSPPPTRARCSRSSRSAPTTSPAGTSLSPGERTRAALALLTAARRQLPRARRADEPPRPRGDRGARDGARRLRRHLVVVTHDRRFLEQLGVTRTIEL